MDREEIKTYLPHREPMLLVDSIVVETETAADGTEQHYAVATYKVRGDEFFIQGHFPDYPVVPGVILCEMMAQSCALLLGDEIKSKRPLYTGIDNVRFKHKVVPGDTLQIQVHLTEPFRRGIATVEGKAFVGDTLACEATLMAQISKNQK